MRFRVQTTSHRCDSYRKYPSLLRFSNSKIASKSQNRKHFSDLPVSPDIPLAPASFRKDISLSNHPHHHAARRLTERPLHAPGAPTMSPTPQ
ncbi:hypothetical protein U2A404240060 [Corynebacterium striatum]|nr:hypothetical protein U2A404240060 [Corynebacterium striatum]